VDTTTRHPRHQAHARTQGEDQEAFAVNSTLTGSRRVCRVCGYRLDRVLVELGEDAHPCCAVDCRTAAEIKADATRAYRRALRSGELTPAECCQRCGALPGRTALHGHHWHGYSAGHALDVEWLCPRCHRLAHGGTP
jgi:hypothetical protein